MKVIRLQVGYEKIFPYEYFELSKYKKVIELGLIDKLTNSDFENQAKLQEHLIRFIYIRKLLENSGDAEKVKYMNIDDIEVELKKIGIVQSKNKIY